MSLVIGRQPQQRNQHVNVLLGPQHARTVRTVALLAALVVLNAFDLAFTQTQMQRGNFLELNQLAAAVAVHGPAGVTIYKMVLFGLGTYILYRCRKHWESEAGAWLLTACYAGLMAWWVAYIDVVEISLQDPAVVATIVPY